MLPRCEKVADQPDGPARTRPSTDVAPGACLARGATTDANERRATRSTRRDRHREHRLARPSLDRARSSRILLPVNDRPAIHAADSTFVFSRCKTCRRVRLPGRSRSLTADPPSRTVRLQPKSSYQEWQRDRPVEATTTYRRIGKVPSPGRSSCTIREPPFGDPPIRPRRSPVPRSRDAHRSLPENDHGDRDPNRTHIHWKPADRRDALSQLRRWSADRPVLRLSGLFRSTRGRLRLRRHRDVTDPRHDRRHARPASGDTPSSSRSMRRRRAVYRSAPPRSSRPTAWRPSWVSTAC